MRYVRKGNEPASLIDWKSMASTDWAPSYSVLQNPQKRELQIALLEEQGWTCCYCGRELDLPNSHIEHFRPQSSYEDLSLVYTNLFVSCIRETKPGSPLHCGHLKDDWFDEDCHISPLQNNCEQQFSYTLDGQIIALTREALNMASVLGLNSSFLIGRRQEALSGVFDEEFLSSVSLPELQNIATVFREQDSGQYTAFFHAIARYAEQLIAGATRQQNQNLLGGALAESQ